MKTMNATEAKTKFGELLDTARSEPVAIQKNGRDVAVVVSADEYEKYVSAKGPNPLIMHFGREAADEYEASFKKLAE